MGSKFFQHVPLFSMPSSGMDVASCFTTAGNTCTTLQSVNLQVSTSCAEWPLPVLCSCLPARSKRRAGIPQTKGLHCHVHGHLHGLHQWHPVASWSSPVAHTRGAQPASRGSEGSTWATPRECIAQRVVRCSRRPHYGSWLRLRLHHSSLLFLQGAFEAIPRLMVASWCWGVAGM